MQLIETHAHLYAEEFNEDRTEMLQRAKDAGVSHFLLPGIDSHSIEAMLTLEAAEPQCMAMMGLHPCYVKENWEAELAIVENWLQQRSFVAVGEIGLDFYWDRTFEQAQKEAFKRQIQLANQYKLPIVIHSRNATQETIDMVKSYKTSDLKGVFHCFSGSHESAKQIVELGFLLGIGGVVTYKNAGLPAALSGIDLSHIVLETDAPYLPPVPYRGKRNESAYLVPIAVKLAEIYGVSEAEVARATTENAKKLFAL